MVAHCHTLHAQDNRRTHCIYPKIVRNDLIPRLRHSPGFVAGPNNPFGWNLSLALEGRTPGTHCPASSGIIRRFGFIRVPQKAGANRAHAGHIPGSPLSECSTYGSCEAVKALLQRKADVRALTCT